MAYVQPTPQQIQNWVESNFDKYTLRRGGQEIIMPNPADPYGKMKFNIALDKGVCHDWRANYQQYDGSFLKFVMLYKKISFQDAVKEVCGMDVRVSKQKNNVVGREVILKLPPGCRAIDKKEGTAAWKMAVHYLERRGIDYERAKELNIHYDPTRLVFPYYEWDMLVYWQSREMMSKVFDFPPETVGVSKSQFLFGFDGAEPNEIVFLTEAIFDALTLGQGALAIGGSTLSDIQIRKLRAINPSEVCVAFDNDQAGVDATKKMFFQLNPYFKVSYVLPPKKYKDWNNLGQAGDWDVPIKYAMLEKRPMNISTVMGLRYRP